MSYQDGSESALAGAVAAAGAAGAAALAAAASVALLLALAALVGWRNSAGLPVLGFAALDLLRRGSRHRAVLTCQRFRRGVCTLTMI